MTEKPTGADGDDGSELVARDADAEDAKFEPEDADAAEDAAEPRGIAGSAGLLALGVALLSAAGVAYLLLGDDTPAADPAQAEQLASLSASLSAARDQVADLERQLAALARQQGGAAEVDVRAIERDVERNLERRLEERLRGSLDPLATVPARVASMEQALTALRGISTGARDAWLLAEAEYYMQIANAQLQLAANPLLASLALKLADERLLELGDPGLTDVRRTLAAEIRALDLLEQPDTEGAALTLASLSSVVNSLPINQEIVVEGAASGSPAGDLSGTERALASLKQAMSGVVRVRRTDEEARPLMAPDAAYFLRANLSLQLQAARLALLRGEQALFRQSLDDAAAWLREYYDTESAPVRSALGTIAEVRESSVTRALPDISESLRLIREYAAFIDAARDEVAPPPRREQTPPAPPRAEQTVEPPRAEQTAAEAPSPEQPEAPPPAVEEAAAEPARVDEPEPDLPSTDGAGADLPNTDEAEPELPSTDEAEPEPPSADDTAEAEPDP